MLGVITGRDVIRHTVLIVRLWGPRCYLRCLRAALRRTSSTFLDVVFVMPGSARVRDIRSQGMLTHMREAGSVSTD